jgi:hypothetical protein
MLANFKIFQDHLGRRILQKGAKSIQDKYQKDEFELRHQLNERTSKEESVCCQILLRQFLCQQATQSLLHS